jgi:hypothetical protein
MVFRYILFESQGLADEEHGHNNDTGPYHEGPGLQVVAKSHDVIVWIANATGMINIPRILIDFRMI